MEELEQHLNQYHKLNSSNCDEPWQAEVCSAELERKTQSCYGYGFESYNKLKVS